MSQAVFRTTSQATFRATVQPDTRIVCKQSSDPAHFCSECKELYTLRAARQQEQQPHRCPGTDPAKFCSACKAAHVIAEHKADAVIAERRAAHALERRAALQADCAPAPPSMTAVLRPAAEPRHGTVRAYLRPSPPPATYAPVRAAADPGNAPPVPSMRVAFAKQS